jgi:dihydroorotate dehydrogenase (NAD+) catalytic subunit
MGGIASGRDALEFAAVGASDVAIGTILFAEPEAPNRIRAELERETRARGLASPADAVGVAHAVSAFGELAPLQNTSFSA